MLEAFFEILSTMSWTASNFRTLFLLALALAVGVGTGVAGAWIANHLLHINYIGPALLSGVVGACSAGVAFHCLFERLGWSGE